MRCATVSCLSLVLPFVAACADEVREGTFASRLEPCHGPFPMGCRPYIEADGTRSLLYDTLLDHHFTWGVEETLRYRVEDVDDPPADGSSIVYHLEEVLGRREEQAGAQFTSRFPFRDPEPWFTPAVDGIVEYLGAAVACDPALCAQLTELTVEEYAVTFEHTGSAVVPLRAISVEITP